MRRREFITLVGGAALPWPLPLRAQQLATPVVGILGSASARGYESQIAAFRRGLQESGYGEGRNVTIEYRWAEGRSDRLPALVADLLNRQVSVIAAVSGPAAVAAKAATATVPIVFQAGFDPVAVGLVASLNQPGGNVTGVTTLSLELGPKRLELMRELVPNATVMAALVNPSNPINLETNLGGLRIAARALGLTLHVLHASTQQDFDTVFATLAELRPGGLVIAGDQFFTSQMAQLGALTARHAVPAIFQYREFTAAGGLMSYGSSTTEAYHAVGVYTGRVLNGESPAKLPVQRSPKVELIVNLKTAKALGLTVPVSLLGRADEVIE